jgi:protein-tyrosine phosphatase
MAEFFTRTRLAGRFGPGPDLIRVGSAGTVAESGYPLWPLAREELTRRGLEPRGFRSRRLRPEDLRSVDVVLTATRELRDEVRAHVPEVYERTFTIRELAWLLRGARAERIKELTPAQRLPVLPRIADGRRGQVVAPDVAELDLPDPVGRTGEHFRQVADEIDRAVSAVVDLL